MRYQNQGIDDCYRKIEAMYRKGFTTQEIARSVRQSYLATIDIVQKIFAMDMRKKERES